MTSVAPSRRPTTTRPPGPRGRLLTGNVLAYDADRIGFLSAAVREYGGWRLRAGDSLMFSPYLIHRDPRWWHEPERIDPDRWPAGRPPHTRHAYLPFGAGPRVCLGTYLGTLQLVPATSRLVHRYPGHRHHSGRPAGLAPGAARTRGDAGAAGRAATGRI
jgi:hypothetical protein